MSAVTILGVEVTPAALGGHETGIVAGRFSVTIDPSWERDRCWVARVHVLDADGNGLFPFIADEYATSVADAAESAEHTISTLLAIGRAQGLREAAGIARTTTWAVGNTHVIDAITAAAERAERGEG